MNCWSMSPDHEPLGQWGQEVRWSGRSVHLRPDPQTLDCWPTPCDHELLIPQSMKYWPIFPWSLAIDLYTSPRPIDQRVRGSDDPGSGGVRTVDLYPLQTMIYWPIPPVPWTVDSFLRPWTVDLYTQTMNCWLGQQSQGGKVVHGLEGHIGSHSPGHGLLTHPPGTMNCWPIPLDHELLTQTPLFLLSQMNKVCHKNTGFFVVEGYVWKL